MALNSGWVVLAVCGVAAIAVVAGLFWPGRSGARRGGEIVARAERLKQLPSVQRAARARITALAALLVLATGATIVAGVVAARPMSARTIEPEVHTRDIMLCLDVSGSMSAVDIEILDVFDRLAEGFEGERIGLTIFNSSPVQVFPLTDDYAFMRERIDSLRASIERGTTSGEIPEHWAGTLEGPGSSLIGDGLAACALRFDHADEERSRSIILATDNEAVGNSIVSLDEAAAYSADRAIRVFALNPIQDHESTPSEILTRAAESTGGGAYALRGSTTVGDIIDEVQAEEARAIGAQPEIVWTDSPAPWILVLVAAASAVVIVLWRVRA